MAFQFASYNEYLRLEERRSTILKLLNERKCSLTRRQISDITGYTHGEATNTLKVLKETELIKFKYIKGRTMGYSITPKGRQSLDSPQRKKELFKPAQVNPVISYKVNPVELAIALATGRPIESLERI